MTDLPNQVDSISPDSFMTHSTEKVRRSTPGLREQRSSHRTLMERFPSKEQDMEAINLALMIGKPYRELFLRLALLGTVMIAGFCRYEKEILYLRQKPVLYNHPCGPEFDSAQKLP